jgi:hypothetical protein
VGRRAAAAGDLETFVDTVLDDIKGHEAALPMCADAPPVA